MEISTDYQPAPTAAVPEVIRKITPEKKAEYNKKYYDTHIRGQSASESFKESQKKYRESHKEKYREYYRLAQQRHRDKVKSQIIISSEA